MKKTTLLAIPLLSLGSIAQESSDNLAKSTAGFNVTSMLELPTIAQKRCRTIPNLIETE